jgi:hypothetical protein
MRVWYRGGILAGAALMLASGHIGAQIRQGVGGPSSPRPAAGLTERMGHPEVLLNTRDPEFEGGERVIAQWMFRRLDPKAAVGRLTPPKGIDGIIAYPGSRMLMVRGKKDVVASYRAALEKLDREAGAPETPEKEAGERPEVVVAAKGKLALKADQVSQEGGLTRATGHVVIGLADGIELRAAQVRITTEGGRRRIVIEK